MRKPRALVVSALILLALVVIPLSISTLERPQLMVVEWSVEQSEGKITLHAIPQPDNSESNPHYALLDFRWSTTAKYWINPSNKYRFSTSAVVSDITASTNAWDDATSYQVFEYQGTTKRSAGRYDRYNVVAWGRYNAGVIAVTYIWYIGSTIIETDTRMNTLFKWSLTGAAGKMDVQNIMTHEFGHWCGLKDLYADEDYWLTMYGYAGYGETHKQTLGLGDVLGLQEVYGA